MKKIATFNVILLTVINGLIAQNAPPVEIISREQATTLIMNAKQTKGLSFLQIATAVGKDEVWVASALLGQNTMSAEEAKKTSGSVGGIS